MPDERRILDNLKTGLGERPYLNGLAGLKFLAVVMIFLWHSELPDPPVDLGARMCEFFFVTSGLLMAYNYLLRKEVPGGLKGSWAFMWKRFKKVWPLHFVMFLAFLAGEKLRYGVFGLRDLLSAVLNLTLTQAWSWDREIVMDYNGVTWFLSALMVCYFFTPLFLKQLSGSRKKAALTFAAALMLHIALELMIGRVPAAAAYIRPHTTPILRTFEYFMGMAAGRLMLETRGKMTAGAKGNYRGMTFLEIAALAAAVSLMISFESVWNRSAFSAVLLGLAFVYSFDAGAVSHFMGYPAVRKLVGLEFGFFMTHTFVIRAVKIAASGLIPSAAARTGIAFILTLVLAAFYKNVAEPRLFGRIRRRAGQ